VLAAAGATFLLPGGTAFGPAARSSSAEGLGGFGKLLGLAAQLFGLLGEVLAV